MDTVRKSSLLALICILAMLSACAPKTPMPQINAEYYPQCYAPFKQLHESQVALQKRTIGYTAGGAASGAVIGGLLGLLGGSWQSAVSGAISGAIIGGMSGYTMSKIQGMKDQQKRMMAYQATMRVDLANATDIEIAALQSLKCYVQEFETLQKNYAANVITKEEFAKRYAEIRTGITEVGKITNDSYTTMAQRDAEFRTALQGEGGGQRLPTLEERRAIREQKAQKAEAQRKKDLRKQRKKGRKAPAPESSSLAITELKNELDQLQEEAVSKKTEYNAQIQASKTDGSNAQKAQEPAPVSAQQVATTFNDYPDRVLSMEAVENQRKRTLEIMDDAAKQSGIDMV